MKQKKDIILGIDTGGTFTDGVLIEVGTAAVLLKAKAATTRDDLSIGIGECIEKLNLNSGDYNIIRVCLSTTLATNAVVEGKRSKVGLITMQDNIEIDRGDIEKNANIHGRITVNEVIEEELDEEEAVSVIKSMKGHVDALVISGYFSVRNPAHELRVKELAAGILDVPIICGHDLSMSLGFKERTATAVLNAHLLPVIKDLLTKTRVTMEREKIAADLVVMRGDGTMMNENTALTYPVETVLSGAAASVVGGVSMINENDAIFVDLGGTTTDIADMTGGRVLITDEGATIGGRKTRVQAADVYTYGLGGDSRIVPSKSNSGKVGFGPQKAVPICFACDKYPGLLDEILTNYRKSKTRELEFGPFEALILNRNFPETFEQNSSSKKIIDILADGPRSAYYVASAISPSLRRFGLSGLIRRGIVNIISITPTDILHASGEYTPWNAEASRKCIDMLRNEDENLSECLDRLRCVFTDQLTLAVVKSAFAFDGRYDSLLDSKWFTESMAETPNNPAPRAKLHCSLGKNIVAVGAPAQAWLTKLSDRLDTKVMVPENYEVANAIGAAMGIISKTLTAMIRVDVLEKHYVLYTQWERTVHNCYEDARIYALEQLRLHTEKLKKELSLKDALVSTDEQLLYRFSEDDDLDDIYENTITMVISERPACFG